MYFEPYCRGQLTFITTDNCTADCPHCLMHARPGKKHYLTFSQIKKTVDQYLEKGRLFLAVFTGGEPTLLGDELFRSIRYCADLGILTRIVTNCHWAGTEESAKAMLSRLRQAGLKEINFSMDDYHAPYVPIENIRRAWKATKGMGFSAVVIANCHGTADTLIPETIQKYLGEKIAIRDVDHRKTKGPDEKPDEYGTLYLIAEGRLQKLGRAGDAIKNEESYEVMPEERLAGGCGNLVEECAVSYDNKLWACCGIQSENNPVLCIGDLNEHTLDELLTKGADSVLLNALHRLGPLVIKKALLQIDPTLELERDYHTLCEICEVITTDERAQAVFRRCIPALASVMRDNK